MLNGHVAGYFDPASLHFPDGTYPILGLHRRSHKWEQRFVHGIYDVGVNTIDEKGNYHWAPPRQLPPGWEFTLPDFPYDIDAGILTQQECLDKTDAILEQYAGRPQSLPVVQYVFGNAKSLERRLRDFQDRYGFTRYALGNTVKLTQVRDFLKIHRIGRVILKCCPEDRPHIFGCPTELLRFLVKKSPQTGVRFSFDNNKFFRRHGRLWSGKVERSLFLREYLADLGLLVRERPDPQQRL